MKQANLATKYVFNFSGSATRSEYWTVSVISSLAIFLFLYVLDIDEDMVRIVGTGLMAIMATIAMVSVAVRRSRNAGYSPWLALAIFAPYVGPIASIVIGVLPPKAPETTA